MKTITNSASKISFLMLSLSLCVAFLYSVVVGKITLTSGDFTVPLGMVFVYYFTKPQVNTNEKVQSSTFSDSKGE